MNKYLLNGLYALFAILIILAFAFKLFQPIKVLPRMQLAPAFNLTDQNDARLTSEELRGKFVLYNFTYVNCPAPCYNLNKTMQEIQTRLSEAELGDIQVEFITISFDPDRDTSATLRTYADSIGTDTKQWRFATNTNKALLKTIIGSGFETYYEDKGDGKFAFDPSFVLVDGWGIVRAEYRYHAEVSDADRIIRHLSVLAEEVRNSTGTAKLAYEAAHLFLCYAP
jgi:protein SCO1/2